MSFTAKAQIELLLKEGREEQSSKKVLIVHNHVVHLHVKAARFLFLFVQQDLKSHNNVNVLFYYFSSI